MENFSKEELQNAVKVISSTISRCEKIQPKFKEGSAQFSLLRNRIKALKISKDLIESNEIKNKYTIDELEKALPPIISIINKTEKAQSKYEDGSTQFKRFSPIIEAMYIGKVLITNEISKRE